MAGKTVKTEERDAKYLTQMKELPPEETEIKPEVHPKKIIPKKVPLKTTPAAAKVEADTDDFDDDAEYYEKPKLPLSKKDIILGAINIISVIVLIVILFKFPTKAKELKKIRIEALKDEQSVSFEFDKISQAKTKTDQIGDRYVDDSGVVDFVNDLEKIRNENGVIKNVTFANQSPIKDKTGNYGIPVVIELQGNWEQIAADIGRIDLLPYIFRAVKIDVGKPKLKTGTQVEETTVIDPNAVLFKYGIFLYFKEVVK